MSRSTDSPPLACGARWEDGDLVVPVRVVPRASADAALPEDECLKVRITAPPVDGKANEHLCRLLGKIFGVPKRRVTVEKGVTGRRKVVRVIRPDHLPDFLHR